MGDCTYTFAHNINHTSFTHSHLNLLCLACSNTHCLPYPFLCCCLNSHLPFTSHSWNFLVLSSLNYHILYTSNRLKSYIQVDVFLITASCLFFTTSIFIYIYPLTYHNTIFSPISGASWSSLI